MSPCAARGAPALSHCFPVAAAETRPSVPARTSVVGVKPLLCIRHQPSVPLGIIGDALETTGTPWRYVDPWRGEAIPDVEDLSGLVVLGGEMNVDEVEEYPWLADTRALLRSAVDAEVPVLGVCLGAQLLTRAMDAPVGAGTGREIGFRKVEVVSSGPDDPLLSAFAPSALVFQFHADACALPDGAQLLATNDDSYVQAFRIGERAYGVQFHFEVTTEVISTWCDETGPSELREVWGTTKPALLAEAASHLAAQQEAGRRLASAFVDLL